RPSLFGPVNFVSPQYITQAKFAKAFAKALHRPCFLKMPASFLKILLGEMAETLLLNGQFASPQVLTSNGFEFKFTDINETLNYMVDIKFCNFKNEAKKISQSIPQNIDIRRVSVVGLHNQTV